MISATATDRAGMGIAGLDDVLLGGLIRNRLYLVEGHPGSGKTTLALQFLLEGAKRGERGLYITLSETREELLETAASHGWELPPEIEIFELAPAESLLDRNQQQSLLYASDLELDESIQRIFAALDRVRPRLLVLDSLSEIRLLAQGSLRYRRQVLTMKHVFSRSEATVILLDDMTLEVGDKTVHSVAHGVFLLEEIVPLYGAERRRMRVVKYRGSTYRGGYHDFMIARGGLQVFPRLRATEHRTVFERSLVVSGNAALDQLAGGGIERGSNALILGPAGSGKSTFAIGFLAAAVERGEKAALFVFDEELGLLYDRMAKLGHDLPALVDTGLFRIEQIDAAEMSPGQFTQRVRDCVAGDDVRVLVIDSFNGYQAAMPEEQFLLLHMHELLQFLNRKGVTTFVTVAQHGLVGEMKSPVDVTYLADTVILMRFFEVGGRIRRAVSVLKKRGGFHEDTIREYQIGSDGIAIGASLEKFQGVLRGVPTFTGAADDLLPPLTR